MSDERAETPEGVADARARGASLDGERRREARADRPRPRPDDRERDRETGRERRREETAEPEADEQDGETGDRGGRKDRKQSLLHRPAVRIGGIIALILLVGLGSLWWLHYRRFVSTDDAFIDTHLVRLAPRVSGQVIAVYANDNQLVRAGQLLVQIDPAQARAQFEQAVSRVAQARTAIVQAEAQMRASEAAYRQSQANLASAQAQAVKAQSDLKRYRNLKATVPQAVSQEQLDQATAAARSATAEQNAARQQTSTADAQIETARAQVASSNAALRTATAEARQSQLDLEYTNVYAPADGHVAQRSVAVGNYVSPGQQLMAIVPLTVWVTANFKETVLDQIRPNQPVSVHVDACPSADARGHVDSIQRGAGQAFALLPPENATGNFVKVVQRVPVKIVLDRVPAGCVLGPGMSVEPSVTVR